MDENEARRTALTERIQIVEGLVAMLERDDLPVRLRACETLEDALILLEGPDFGLSRVQALHVLDASNRRYVGDQRAALAEELDELRQEAERLA